MKLNATAVHDTFMKCLFNDGEPTDPHVVAEGVQLRVGFNPERLKDAEPAIVEMLNDLPDQFKEGGGGGWSFLNMCNDKDDNQWADLHQTMDELVTLGVAIGKVSFQLPRELWSVLPGGMPYVVIKN